MKNLSKIDEQKDVVDKQYVDSSVSNVDPQNKYLPLNGGTMKGPISIQADEKIKLQNSRQVLDAGQIYYSGLNESLNIKNTQGTVDIQGDSINLKPLSSVDLNNKKISSLADPTNAQDAVTKKYVDDQDVVLSEDMKEKLKDYLPLSGGTMTGSINIPLSSDGDIKQVVVGDLLLSGSDEAKVVSSDYPIMIVKNTNNTNRALTIGLANDIQNPIGIIFSNNSIFNDLLGCENGINATYDLNMLNHRVKK